MKLCQFTPVLSFWKNLVFLGYSKLQILYSVGSSLQMTNSEGKEIIVIKTKYSDFEKEFKLVEKELGDKTCQDLKIFK